MKVIINCIVIIVLFSYFEEEKIPVREITKKVEKLHVIPKIEENSDKIVKELHILHPAFRNKVVMLIYECKKEGIELKVVETYRTPERQDKLKKRKLSMLSGGCSKHQHYLAVDVVPIINGKAIWHNKRLWKKIGDIGEKQGLLWGGKWRMRDYNHFEYPCSLNNIDTISIPDKVIIPLNY